MLDEKEIVRSAFNSDEEAFKQCFEVLPEGAYEYYTEGMEWLNGTGEYGFRKGTEIMNNFFNGNIPNLTKKQRQIKELKKLKSSLSQIQPLSHQQIEQGYERTVKKQGFINIFLLTVILGIIIGAVATITLLLIK